ncbi:putative Transmembrane protein [Quillaja saponaria]|uniref:Transmembrane protein n=1 Tax=Quillaja saponaria TaxID=32244 RepID=A0AAD7VHW4_QUISA|nr:putative Transmembrane protein [Quillaja saponaria]
MAALIYQIFSSSALLSLGLCHLICTTRNYLKSPHTYSAKPFHPFPPSSSYSSSSGNGGRLRHLQLYMLIICLLIAMTHHLIISADADPLLKGRTPVHRFDSLQSAAVIFLFFIVSLCLLLSDSSSLLPFPSDLFFALGSALFFLQYTVTYSAASVQTSDLQAKCDSVSARISVLSSLLCLILACQPRLFVADIGLAAAVCLQGLWVLQTGLSLYVEAFIPDGCHRLLDVVNGVEGSTQCDLEESKFRAVAILDLVFLVHVVFVVLIVMFTYAGVAKSIGIRRLGSYEALPTVAAVSENNPHIQMKAMTGTQA